MAGNLAGSLAACHPSHRAGSIDVKVWELKIHSEHAMCRRVGQGDARSFHPGATGNC